MSDVRRYRAYGVVVASDIDVPEFLPWDDRGPEAAGPPLSIRLGRVPERLPGAVGDAYFQACPDAFVLNVEGVARYLVRDGTDIVIEPAADASEHDVRVYLLGSCMGGVLHQRGLLVLHASAIATTSGATLLCGHSGVGKSTLLGELLRRGCCMLVDDVCAIAIDDAGRPVAHPAYPRTRLWADAATVLGRDVTALPRTQPGMDKYELQVPEHYWSEPAAVRHIYVLTIGERDSLSLKALPVVDRFSALLHHTYRREFLEALAMQPRHFRLASTVARAVPMTRVIRPAAPFRLAELADLIEGDMDGSDASPLRQDASTH